MARTLGITNPLDPSNPIIERRTFDPKVPSWFFEDDLPPNPLPCDWGPLPPLIEGMPLLPPCGYPISPDATRGAAYVSGTAAPALPFIPAASPSAPGGIPGMLIGAGLSDLQNPDAPPPGGLVGLLQEYLRNNARDNN